MARRRPAYGQLERAASTRAANVQRLALLTMRERQVLNLLVGGKTSKEIASSLGASVRTVEGRRARIYLKTGVSSIARLIRLVLAQG
jgi:FixJ family two-component response regulator